MSQLSMFDAPAEAPAQTVKKFTGRLKTTPQPAAMPEAPPPAPEAVKPAIQQPPAFIREGEEYTGENPLNLKPLRVVPADWIDAKTGYIEIAAAQDTLPGHTRTAVMLTLLQQRGIRMAKPIEPTARELSDYIAGPCAIRWHTAQGAYVHVWQAPEKPAA